MSLINDALRRANQQKEQAPAPEGSPMQPAHHPERTKVSFAGPMLLIFFLGVVLTCAAWFFWKALSGKSTSAPATQEASSSVPPEVVPVFAPPETAPERTLPVPQVVESIPAAQPPNTVASNKPAPVASAPEVIAPSPPAAPALKLQGIFYRIARPTALISGKTVGVGEKIEGARVLKIERSEVTLERDGETIVLILN